MPRYAVDLEWEAELPIALGGEEPDDAYTDLEEAGTCIAWRRGARDVLVPARGLLDRPLPLAGRLALLRGLLMGGAERVTWRADRSEALHDAAARWGVMDPERPPLDDTPPEYRVQPVRKIEMPAPSARLKWMDNWIELGTLNGRWTYTHWLTYEIGSTCSPLSIFDDPYPTEEAAILAAADHVEKYARGAHEWERRDEKGKPMRPMIAALIAWAGELRASVQQTSLF